MSWLHQKQKILPSHLPMGGTPSLCPTGVWPKHLEEFQVDVGKATGPQLHLQGGECGEELQGDDGAQPCPHCCHALRGLQLPHPQAPDGGRVHILVLPAAGAEIWDEGGTPGGALVPHPVLHMEGFYEEIPMWNNPESAIHTLHSDASRCPLPSFSPPTCPSLTTGTSSGSLSLTEPNITDDPKFCQFLTKQSFP